MMMKMTLRVLPLLILMILGGCASWFGGDKSEYKTSGRQAPLEVPPELSTPGNDDRYVVPDGKAGGVTASDYNKERVAGKPVSQATGAAQSGVLPAVNDVRVERSGSQRWLVVKSTPELLWPALKDFWKNEGFELPLQQADTGVMETEWKENRAKIKQDAIRNVLGKLLDGMYSSPERDKFRTRLERGTEAGTTEIYISHRGVEEVYTNESKDRTIWQPRSPDPEMEAQMLSKLLLKLGAPQGTTVAAAANTPDRAALTKNTEGLSSLSVSDNFDRAWRRVGLALDRIGFTVEDRDRSKGIYFVRYADPKAEATKENKGFLSSLAFWRSDDNKTKAVPYRIQLSASGDASLVTVQNADGAAEKSATAERILSLLLNELK
jgi:outer membrane protein assembly factor BamC